MGPSRASIVPPGGRDGTGVKEKPPLREVLWGAVKYSSPRHAEKCCILPILSEQGRYFFHDGSEPSGGMPCWGGISFMEARWKWRWRPWSVSMGPRRPWLVVETNRQHTNDKHRPIGGRRGACGAWPGFETTRRAKLAARTASGRAAAHGAARPDTAHATPRNGNTTQEAKPQKRNEKYPRKQRHSQLHSNTPKSHMRNMRAS